MACLNENCPSNTIKNIKDVMIKMGGTFNKKSSWKISLSHCYKCGNKSNKYYFQRIFVFNSQIENDDMTSYLSKNKLQSGDILIYKKKKQNKPFYDYLKVEDEKDPLKFKPSYKESDITNIIKNL